MGVAELGRIRRRDVHLPNELVVLDDPYAATDLRHELVERAVASLTPESPTNSLLCSR